MRGSDRTTFQAYSDRIDRRPPKIIARPSDRNFDEKVRSAIRQKLEATRSDSTQ